MKTGKRWSRTWVLPIEDNTGSSHISSFLREVYIEGVIPSSYISYKLTEGKITKKDYSLHVGTLAIYENDPWVLNLNKGDSLIAIKHTKLSLRRGRETTLILGRYSKCLDDVWEVRAVNKEGRMMPVNEELKREALRRLREPKVNY